MICASIFPTFFNFIFLEKGQSSGGYPDPQNLALSKIPSHELGNRVDRIR